MIHSLIGQSEVLSVLGVYLISSGSGVLGSIMLASGVLGAMLRFTTNFQMLTQNLNNEKEVQEDEKFSRILSEISQHKK